MRLATFLLLKAEVSDNTLLGPSGFISHRGFAALAVRPESREPAWRTASPLDRAVVLPSFLGPLSAYQHFPREPSDHAIAWGSCQMLGPARGKEDL
jgi:hypothetical protein